MIGVPQPTLKWYKDGRELKPGDIHRIISGQDGTCCLGTYTCEASNCMGTVASSASLLGFEGSHFTIPNLFFFFHKELHLASKYCSTKDEKYYFYYWVYVCVFFYSWVFCYSSFKHFRFMIVLSFNSIESMGLQASNKRCSFSIDIYKKPFQKASAYINLSLSKNLKRQ